MELGQAEYDPVFGGQGGDSIDCKTSGQSSGKKLGKLSGHSSPIVHGDTGGGKKVSFPSK